MNDLPSQAAPADRMSLQVNDARQDAGGAPSVACCIFPLCCICFSDEE
jgi:hypothetical protein